MGDQRETVPESFDARVWAREFIKTNQECHIAADEDTMVGWFANALMRGYDEHYWRSKEYKRQIRSALRPWWSFKRYSRASSR